MDEVLEELELLDEHIAEDFCLWTRLWRRWTSPPFVAFSCLLATDPELDTNKRLLLLSDFRVDFLAADCRTDCVDFLRRLSLNLVAILEAFGSCLMARLRWTCFRAKSLMKLDIEE
jgi:hypothetical protein